MLNMLSLLYGIISFCPRILIKDIYINILRTLIFNLFSNNMNIWESLENSLQLHNYKKKLQKMPFISLFL